MDPRVPFIRRFLSISGDLISAGVVSSEQLYTDDLVASVKRFQTRHGLEADGIIGQGTTGVMNVPVEERVLQILMNMERWRWIAHDLGSMYVLVDIVGFDLQGVVDNDVVLEMRVIVGKNHHETPVFSDTIKYVEFNPFWNITPGIARNEMLRKLRNNSGYLATKHIRLFLSWQSTASELNPKTINWDTISRRQIGHFKFRQDPGPWNALGVVKFVFPNKYSVYLHDTPAHNLFENNNRAFSHGCIRLDLPEQLAQFLLTKVDSKWTEDTIRQVVESKDRKVVRLPIPVPVHLVYQTAWIDKSGTLHFSKDLYGRDGKLKKALFGKE